MFLYKYKNVKKNTKIFYLLAIFFGCALSFSSYSAPKELTEAEKQAVGNSAWAQGSAAIRGDNIAIKNFKTGVLEEKTQASSSIYVNATSGASTGIIGLGTQVAPATMVSNYKGGGRNEIDSIETIKSSGQAATTCNSLELCSKTDKACQNRVNSCKAIISGYTSATIDKSFYADKAKQIRKKINDMDPLALLGILSEPEPHSTFCSQLSTTLPSLIEKKQCIYGDFYKVVGFNATEPEIRSDFSPAICPSGMTLNTDSNMCEKAEITCPPGFELNGGSCERPAYCYDANASKNNISAPECPPGYISSGPDTCRQDLFTCGTGHSGGGANNPVCSSSTSYTGAATVNKSCPSSHPYYVFSGDSFICASGYEQSKGPGECRNFGTAKNLSPYGAVCDKGSSAPTITCPTPPNTGTMTLSPDKKTCSGKESANTITTCPSGSAYYNTSIGSGCFVGTAYYATYPNAGSCNVTVSGYPGYYCGYQVAYEYSCPSGYTLGPFYTCTKDVSYASNISCPSSHPWFADDGMCHYGYAQSTAAGQCNDGGTSVQYRLTNDKNEAPKGGCLLSSITPTSTTTYSCPISESYYNINRIDATATFVTLEAAFKYYSQWPGSPSKEDWNRYIDINRNSQVIDAYVAYANNITNFFNSNNLIITQQIRDYVFVPGDSSEISGNPTGYYNSRLDSWNVWKSEGSLTQKYNEINSRPAKILTFSPVPEPIDDLPPNTPLSTIQSQYESTCNTFVSYIGQQTTSFAPKACGSTGATKTKSAWQTISIEGDSSSSSNNVNGAENFVMTWLNVLRVYPNTYKANTYTWKWKFTLTDKHEIDGWIDEIYQPPNSTVTLKLNGSNISIGKVSSSNFVEGNNEFVLTMIATADTHPPGVQLHAVRRDMDYDLTQTCLTQATYCAAGGTLSGNNCCLPKEVVPSELITVQVPYTCEATLVSDPFYRCGDINDFYDSKTKKCYTLKDPVTVPSMTTKNQSVDIGGLFRLNLDASGRFWATDYITGDSPADAASKGDGSGVLLDFDKLIIDNCASCSSTTMFIQGVFETTVTKPGLISFTSNGSSIGQLHFEIHNSHLRIFGGVATPNFSFITNGTSCIKIMPGDKELCFSDTKVICPLGYELVEGMPKACAWASTEPVPYCPDTFTLSTSSSGANVCAKTPDKNLDQSNCEIKYAQCPDGMYLDPSSGQCFGEQGMRIGDDCEELPQITKTADGSLVKSKTFLCKVGVLDECASLEKHICTQDSDECIDHLNISGSSKNGICTMREQKYTCTTPPQIVESTVCGYKPLCFNGTCFTPPGTQCEGSTIDQTKTETKSCDSNRTNEHRQCSLIETMSGGIVTGYKLGADCTNINSMGSSYMNCTLLEPTIDPSSGRYPTKAIFSCVGDAVDSIACSEIQTTPNCSISSTDCLDYQCLDPLTYSQEVQEQAGINTSIIASNANFTGVVQRPSVDRNTCINKGACLIELKNYACTSTSSMPGDECTTDLSKVLVSMETGRQAGNYLNPEDIKIFSGEFSRCDRRAVSVLGGGAGSKSCCNISSPDPKSNAELMGSPLMQGYSLLGSAVAAGSSYAYDYMMSSQKFVTAAQELWAAGALTDNMAQQGLNVAQSSAESLASFNFSPSVSIVPGFSIGYGSITGGGTSLIGSTSTVVNAAGTTATTTTTVAGVSTTTTTTAIGNTGFNFSYNPTMLYVTAAMMAYQAYQAALACDEEDYKSSTKGKAKLCYDTGTWCEKKDCGIFGCTCVKFRTGKCCFNSKLARIINQQGRPQLGLDMRVCDGFTVSQIQALDWSRIDLSEFIADMLAQAQQSTASIMGNATQTVLQNKLKSSATTNAESGTQPKLPVSH